MGTANKQIATAANVALKRINPGYTGTHCVTKSDITPIEFLAVNNRENTTQFYTNIGEYAGQMDVTSNYSSYRQGVTAENTYTYHNSYGNNTQLYINIYAPNKSGYTNVVKLTSAWPSTGTACDSCALLKQRLTGLPTNRALTFNYNCYIQGTLSDSSYANGIGGSVRYAPDTVTANLGVIVTDTNGNIIANDSPNGYTVDTFSESFSFSTTQSVVDVYFIFPVIECSFYTSATEYYSGLCINLYTDVQYYESYYDQTYKCVQYQDINHPASKTFTIYYGVWNNKSSNAKLDNLYVQIKKSTESSWTTIGTKSLPSSLNSSTTGSVTCTLPTSFDPTVAYDFRVTAGDTSAKQKWYYRWGSQSTLTSSGYSWTTYSSSAKTGVCSTSYGLNGTSAYSVLKNHSTSSSTLHYGRSTSYAALFCIE